MRDRNLYTILFCLALFALASVGCTLENRNGAIWACDTVQTSAGQFSACQDTGIHVY